MKKYFVLFFLILINCTNPIKPINDKQPGNFIIVKDLLIDDTKTIWGQTTTVDIDGSIVPFNYDDSTLYLDTTSIILPDSLKILWYEKCEFLDNLSGFGEGASAYTKDKCYNFIDLYQPDSGLHYNWPISIYPFDNRFLTFEKDSIHVTEIDSSGITIQYKNNLKYLTSNKTDSFVVADSMLDTLSNASSIYSIRNNIFTHIIKIGIYSKMRILYPPK